MYGDFIYFDSFSHTWLKSQYQLLGHDSSGSESIEENISESGSSGNYEPPLDFTQSEDFLARQIQGMLTLLAQNITSLLAALFRDDTKHSRITETASISSSETTESTESDDYGAEDYTTHMVGLL